MRCYSCGAELSEHNFCTNCGADVTTYKKVVRTSNYFYNQGLEKAKVRDLSGAAVCLRESLKFNKNSINARNLLGLIYFETGEVAAALSEWVISKNLRSKKNIACDYLQMVQSNTTLLNSYNECIKKYNQDLERCHQDAVDLAVIDLKKVRQTCPNFLRARQLLALCFIQTGKYESARKELLCCKALDVNNTLTLRYLHIVEDRLNPSDAKSSDVATESERYIDEHGDLVIKPPPIKEKKGSATVLNIIVGLAIGFAVAYFFFLPARIQSAEAKVQEEARIMATQLDARNLSITELERTISEQNEKIASLSTSLDAYAGTEGTLLSMENLLQGAAFYLQNPTDNATILTVADYILNVDETSWTEDTSENYIALYNAIKTAIGPTVCDLYYIEGNTAYKNKEYEDAAAYLERAVFFDGNDADALYLLANTYRLAERYEEAKTAFNTITELFPDSWYSSKAADYIKELNK